MYIQGDFFIEASLDHRGSAHPSAQVEHPGDEVNYSLRALRMGRFIKRTKQPARDRR
jgi:hypothetical protein